MVVAIFEEHTKPATQAMQRVIYDTRRWPNSCEASILFLNHPTMFRHQRPLFIRRLGLSPRYSNFADSKRPHSLHPYLSHSPLINASSRRRTHQAPIPQPFRSFSTSHSHFHPQKILPNNDSHKQKNKIGPLIWCLAALLVYSTIAARNSVQDCLTEVSQAIEEGRKKLAEHPDSMTLEERRRLEMLEIAYRNVDWWMRVTVYPQWAFWALGGGAMVWSVVRRMFK